MDEKMISELRMKSGEHWKKIMEKYGSGEKGTVLDFKDFLQGRQAASVTLHGCSVELPIHRQNFIEFIYAYEGRIVTEIDGKELVQEKGDILLMNQYVEHRVKPTGNENEALILAALPDFFEKPLEMMKKQSLITDFLTNMLRQNSKKPEYLMFHLNDQRALENLVENLTVSLCDEDGSKNSEISQYTMGLIFLYLSEHMDRVAQNSSQSYKSIIINETQKYIELQYRTARLSQIAEDFNLSLPALSKLIKEGTGNTFQELLMKKRFERAAELLIDTNLPVEEIALNVGYENQSYFHRQFKMRYNITPRRYRLVHRRKMGR